MNTVQENNVVATETNINHDSLKFSGKFLVMKPMTVQTNINSMLYERGIMNQIVDLSQNNSTYLTNILGILIRAIDGDTYSDTVVNIICHATDSFKVKLIRQQNV
jgi:hypothetical protein